ncbi:amidohydrolase family protein [Steroidobacter sp.]|uniref:amidohydrolase family protein n=1 Tax=Steroidobacter sp. TaxID=1978227 RepID=UPI001A3D5665|nr:amidohydrolase family protein [Steroidobacter sp.]MBL8270937.1 PD40 domain-containing protein [Steroidobacter sp.]
MKRTNGAILSGLMMVAALSVAFAAPNDGSAQVFAIKPARTFDFSVSEGTRMNPDVSPDGRQLVFELLGDVYVLPIEGGAARALTQGPAVDHHPRFSPDGRHIAFLSDRSGTDNLWIMNADGSGARMISRQSATERPKQVRFFMTPSWSPDGQSVLAAVASELTFYGAEDIRRFPLDGGADTSVTNAPPIDVATRPVFTAKRSPFPLEGVDPQLTADAGTLYYSKRTPLVRLNDEKLMPQYQVGKLDLNHGDLQVITNAPMGAFTPRLSPDGRWLVYAVRHDADTGLRVRDLASGEDRWLVFPVDRDGVENWWTESLVNAYSFLPDSASLVTSFEGKLWRIEVPTGKVQPLPFIAKVHVEAGAPLRSPVTLNVEGPVQARYSTGHKLSPDGRTLVFETLGRIWIKRWPNGEPRRLTQDGGAWDEEADPSWSADGRAIVFSGFSLDGAKGHIYETTVASGCTRAVTAQPGYYLKPVLTPDDQTIVALQARADGDALYAGVAQAQIVRVSRREGTKVPVLPVSFGLNAPDLIVLKAAPDRVYFIDGSGTLISVRLDGSDQRKHLSLQGLGVGAVGVNSAMQVARALLDASGRTLIVQHNATQFGQIDRIDVSALDLLAQRPATNDVPTTAEGGSMRKAVRRVTALEGGLSPFWSADGREVLFTIGERVLKVASDAANTPTDVTRIGLSEAAPQRDGAVLLSGARLLTMTGEPVIERGDILIEGRRIKAIGAAGAVDAPRGVHRLDVSGLTIMPGLVSSHSHHFEGGQISPLVTAEWPLQAKLAYGVTTVFDPAPPLRLFTMADRIRSDRAVGPRVLLTGPIVLWNDPVGSVADADRIAGRGRSYGECCMKIYDVGGRLNRQWLFDAVHRAGMTPIPESEGSLNASLALLLDGVTHLPHGLAMPAYDDVTQLLVRTGASMSYQFNTLVGNGGPSTSFYFYNHLLNEQDPMLRRWIPHQYLQVNNRRRVNVADEEYVFRMYGQHLASMMDAGVPIHVGEHGVLHGLANHWAVWALANGAGNQRALEAATILAARALGIDSQVGSLAPGKLADLIVISDDPREDIRATAKLRYVMKEGELFDPQTLDRLAPTTRTGPKPWWRDLDPVSRPGATSAGGVAPWHRH